jgi:hypothetical protein
MRQLARVRIAEFFPELTDSVAKSAAEKRVLASSEALS